MDNFISALRKVEAAIRKIDESPEMLLATKSEDIWRAKKEGKIAIILGFQDGKALEDDLSHLRVFHRLGVRIIQLTYNTQNLIGTGCCELARGWLTYFGREVVEEMNKLGIAVDLSHCVDATTLDAIETSKTPPVFTHANVRSLCNTPRNKTDDQIKDLAEKGGVMGISVFPVMLKGNTDHFAEHHRL